MTRTSLRGAASFATSWPAFTAQAAFVLAFSALAAPTIATIARVSWTDEQAQAAPMVLIIGTWLLWRRWPVMAAADARGAIALAAPLLALSAFAYVAGRIGSLYLLEAYALYAFGLSSVYALVGGSGFRLALFPLAFLAFAIPAPFAVGWPVTVALRLWISQAAVVILHGLGVNAARDGLTLYVASYKIEIEQACSGMNSLLALSALGVCYIHLRRDPTFAYFLLLAPVILLIAIGANMARVLLLAGVTLSLGDEAAQGLLHQGLGFVVFGVALAATWALDEFFAHFPFIRERFKLAR